MLSACLLKLHSSNEKSNTFTRNGATCSLQWEHSQSLGVVKSLFTIFLDPMASAHPLDLQIVSRPPVSPGLLILDGCGLFRSTERLMEKSAGEWMRGSLWSKRIREVIFRPSLEIDKHVNLAVWSVGFLKSCS
uniref:Uncharacterized protein n=1 Tax=Pyxicephalus adspersus TaxID=30357 RepID=A0AAV3B3S3_PYXAD|nr:TPA: hypothetical protein GDO54_000088 [Pyxicephalus adspersus]